MTDTKARNVHMLIAGFGGQGVLFTGKIIATTAMIEGREVSWLPSYGPEMRGGTANCSVCVEDKPIGCPIVLAPMQLVAMNQPSYDKFIGAVQPGGVVVYDSTLIQADTAPDGITVCSIPATQMANDEGLHGLANIIVLGRVLRATGFTTYEVLTEAIKKCVPPKKAHLLEPNLRALKLGYENSD